MPRVLLTWVGTADLNAATGAPSAGLGPIGQAVKERAFDHVVLLSDWPKAKAEPFRKMARLVDVGFFAKPVKSYVKCWQMIGLGTRLCRDLFGPGSIRPSF